MPSTKAEEIRMTHLDHMTETLAKEFCAELRATITPEELAEAVRLNHEDGGTADSRDLWPILARLIQVARPSDVFGEQVEAAIRWGWLDRLCDDLESQDYACWAAVLTASGLGAHQIRARLFWHGTHSDANRLRSQRIRKATKGPWSREQFEGLVQNTLRTAVPSGKCGGLSDGLPARVLRLSGYGDSIIPQVAAQFIEARASQ